MHTNEQIKIKFAGLKKKLRGAALRSEWFQDHTNSHTLHNCIQMIEQLEHEFDIKLDPSCGMSHK